MNSDSGAENLGCEMQDSHYGPAKKGSEIARLAYADIGLKPFEKIPPEMKDAYRKAKNHHKYLRHLEKLPKGPNGKPQEVLTKKQILDRDRQWGRRHRNDTDEELLEYLRRTAEELGYTPHMLEVPGGHYIELQFCGWNVAVTLAGLPLGRKMKPPTSEIMKLYEKKCAERMAMKAEAEASH